MSILEKWKYATELNAAYFEFADPYQREKFRNAKSENAIEGNRRLLIADLFAQLASESLVALGFQIEPMPLDGPVMIPAHCFMQRPNFADCEEDVVAASGWKYERVKVARAENPVLNELADTAPLNAEPARRGRTSTYQAAAKTLAVMCNSDPRFLSQSADQMIDEFNKNYAALNRIDGVPFAGLAPRTLRNHLKRFRQELAESGKNNSAN